MTRKTPMTPGIPDRGGLVALALLLALLGAGCDDSEQPIQHLVPSGEPLTVAVAAADGFDATLRAAHLAAGHSLAAGNHSVLATHVALPGCTDDLGEAADELASLALEPGFLGTLYHGCPAGAKAVAALMTDAGRAAAAPYLTGRDLPQDALPGYLQLQLSSHRLARAAGAFFHGSQRRRRLLAYVGDNPRDVADARAVAAHWQALRGASADLRPLASLARGPQDAASHALAAQPDLLLVAAPGSIAAAITTRYAALTCSAPPSTCARRPRPFALLLTQGALTTDYLARPQSRQSYFLVRSAARTGTVNDVTGDDAQAAAMSADPTGDWRWSYDALTLLVAAWNNAARPHLTKTLVRQADYEDALSALDLNGLSGPLACTPAGDCSTQTARILYQPASATYNRPQDLPATYEEPQP